MSLELTIHDDFSTIIDGVESHYAQTTRQRRHGRGA